MNAFIQIHPSDVVAVALRSVSAGETVTVGGHTITVLEDIPCGHKMALTVVPAGSHVIKYGYSIGTARCDIQPGSHVHTHNVATALTGAGDYTYEPVAITDLTKEEPKTFNGYRRADGSVGVRNEVWIIPTVGCVNAIAGQIAVAAQAYKTDHIDGIYHFTHPYGCSQLGGDLLYTQKLLSGMIRHPNAGAVLVLGLGCENNQIDDFKKILGPVDEERVAFLICQDEDDELAAAEAIMKRLCAYADRFRRTPCPASDLVLGMKCGGSDGLSGITANPLVGRVCDRLVAMGGKAMLTEVPEMFGAETVLMNRCRDEQTFQKTVRLINDFKDYFGRYGEGVGENPSPGNKAGGITTLEDKSLGCIQKGGFSAVNDVLSYGDPIKANGLSLLQAPGNDLVATCALCASGAQIVLFTTGRGTPFAGPVPTLKIATNTDLATRKASWIDFNAGRLVDGMSMQQLSDELLNTVLAVASGQTVKSERLSKAELSIFKDGVTL